MKIVEIEKVEGVNMGDRLAKYYDFMEKEGGAAMKMRLAMKTGVSSIKATDAPDSPELIEKIRATIRDVLGVEAPDL